MTTEQGTCTGEPALFGATAKDARGTVHLMALSGRTVCGKPRREEWIGIPTWWEMRCAECFGVIR